MPGSGENLPVSSGEDADVLGITIDELFHELEGIFSSCEARRAGDIDDDQLMERFGCSEETVRVKMRQVIKNGTWKRVKVFDGGRRISVYRKIS